MKKLITILFIVIGINIYSQEPDVNCFSVDTVETIINLKNDSIQKLNEFIYLQNQIIEEIKPENILRDHTVITDTISLFIYNNLGNYNISMKSNGDSLNINIFLKNKNQNIIISSDTTKTITIYE